jgi:hypothetical protein
MPYFDIYAAYATGLLKTGRNYQESNPPEDKRSYSSVYENILRQSMLDSPAAWAASVSAVGQYMTITLDAAQTVAGVVTQGRERVSDTRQWVTAFKVQTSSDCKAFIAVDNNGVFTGNTDESTRVNNLFSAPVQGVKCVRILPQSFNGWMSMRAGLLLVLGEKMVDNYASIPPGNVAITGTMVVINGIPTNIQMSNVGAYYCCTDGKTWSKCDGYRGQYDHLFVRTDLYAGSTSACDETLRGDKGSGYRGCQTKTRTGSTCQAWAADSPQRHLKSNELTNPDIPNPNADVASLDGNFCRNPTPNDRLQDYPTIW